MSDGLFRGIDDSLDAGDTEQGFSRLNNEWDQMASAFGAAEGAPDYPPEGHIPFDVQGEVDENLVGQHTPSADSSVEAAEFLLVDENDTERESAPAPSGELIAPHLAPPEQGRVLYEFGPFNSLANKLGNEIPKLADGDPHEVAFANMYLSKVRELLSNAIIDLPGAADDGVAGMTERIAVLELFDKNLNDFHIKLKQKYGDEHLQYAGQYRSAVGSLLRVEHKKIETLRDSLGTITPGKVVAGLVNIGVEKIFGRADPEISGRLRQARERAIDQRLDALDRAATEMAHGNRVGNADWEQRHGADYVKEAEKSLKETQDLMKKIMKQTDDRGFIKRFQGIQTKFDELQKRAATDKLRTALTGLCAGIRKFVSSVLEKVGFIVDKGEKNINVGKPVSFGP